MLGSGTGESGSDAVSPPAVSSFPAGSDNIDGSGDGGPGVGVGGGDGESRDDGSGDECVEMMTVGEVQRACMSVLFNRLEALKEALREERVHRKMWERRTDFLMEYNLCLDCLEMRRDACQSGNYDHKVGWVPWGCAACKYLEPFMVMPNEVSEDEKEEHCDCCCCVSENEDEGDQ